MSAWEAGDEEITIEFDNRSGKYTNLPAAWSAPSQTDQPRTWTAPVSGRYHFVSGREPHLVEDCTEECA